MARFRVGFTTVREQLERHVLPYALWLAAASYTILRFLDTELKLTGWEFPLILVTLALVLHIVDDSRASLLEETASLRKDSQSQHTELVSKRTAFERSETRRALQLGTKIDNLAMTLHRHEDQLQTITETLGDCTHLRVYDTADTFFEGLQAALAQATSRVWVSYVREGAPEYQVAEGQEYFTACEEWAKHPGRSFRRIIYCHPNNASVREWVSGEHAKTFDASCHFSVKVWPDNARDRISIALFDDKAIFCSFVADRDDIQAFSLEDAAVVQHFRGFFMRLWDMSMTTVEFLNSPP